MLNALRQQIYINPLITIIPGLFIFVTALSVNIISDGLKDAMEANPRQGCRGWRPARWPGRSQDAAYPGKAHREGTRRCSDRVAASRYVSATSG